MIKIDLQVRLNFIHFKYRNIRTIYHIIMKCKIMRSLSQRILWLCFLELLEHLKKLLRQGNLYFVLNIYFFIYDAYHLGVDN